MSCSIRKFSIVSELLQLCLRQQTLVLLQNVEKLPTQCFILEALIIA